MHNGVMFGFYHARTATCVLIAAVYCVGIIPDVTVCVELLENAGASKPIVTFPYQSWE